MPILYEVDRSQQRISTVVEGPVTVADILGHLDSVRREQALPLVELIDVKRVGQPSLSPTDIWRAASAVKAVPLTGPLGPRAVIAEDDLIFGLVRIFTNLMTGTFPIQVFRSREQAEEWLAR
jgi:hypothetical protein